MKLARFTTGGAAELGAVEGDRVVALTGLAADMTDLIARWPTLEAAARRMAKDAARAFALKDVTLKAPIARPGKVMAIGLNYADHIAETGAQKPEHQTWFAKMGNAINGPFDDVIIPRLSHATDYEAELVTVIGAGGKHISKADAPRAVFGYCLAAQRRDRARVAAPHLAMDRRQVLRRPRAHWPVDRHRRRGGRDPHALGIRWPPASTARRARIPIQAISSSTSGTRSLSSPKR